MIYYALYINKPLPRQIFFWRMWYLGWDHVVFLHCIGDNCLCKYRLERKSEIGGQYDNNLTNSFCRWCDHTSGVSGDMSQNLQEIRVTQFCVCRLWLGWSVGGSIPPRPTIGTRFFSCAFFIWRTCKHSGLEANKYWGKTQRRFFWKKSQEI